MCKHHKSFVKVLIVIIILIALALAVSISVWGQSGLTYVVYVGRFFDIMIPVLAVGALIKYLLCGSGHCCCHHMHMHGEDCKCEQCEAEKKEHEKCSSCEENK